LNKLYTEDKKQTTNIDRQPLSQTFENQKTNPGYLVLYLHICQIGGEQTATGSPGLGYIISGNLSV